jgi:hypothetical protein
MSLASILKRLEAIEAKLNLDRKTGNWVRNLSGALVWDSWDMDAPPEHDPTPGILDQLQRIRERLQAQPGWTEPSEAEKAAAGRLFEDARRSRAGGGEVVGRDNRPAAGERELISAPLCLDYNNGSPNHRCTIAKTSTATITASSLQSKSRFCRRWLSIIFPMTTLTILTAIPESIRRP